VKRGEIWWAELGPSPTPQLASQSGVDLPVRASALLEQGNEAGLLKMTEI
jgi:hypothetical protein